MRERRAPSHCHSGKYRLDVEVTLLSAGDEGGPHYPIYDANEMLPKDLARDLLAFHPDDIRLYLSPYPGHSFARMRKGVLECIEYPESCWSARRC